ncbi:molybdenum cofactor guanylyltransferase [Nocardioides limicola]|uniref:molybdenum cofactor guanylyltransferase n=1 Tax=Nocardioides limicola TaxID=2803368 RepID=UPI0027DD6FA0|nr:nucleotidyltransferase family protein [Nocardioides sp. DJM-14]
MNSDAPGFDLSAAGFCAVVLAGGGAARMGGVDKGSVEVGGRTMLDRVLEALVDADEVVVVGDQVPTDRPVTFVMEEPRRGGPAAGLLTGVDSFLRRPRLIAVVAVDMPLLTAATFRRLREAKRDHDGAFLVETSSMRRQLVGVIDADRLAQVRPGPEDRHGLPMHKLLADLDLVDVPGIGREAIDIDSWTDLRDLDA